MSDSRDEGTASKVVQLVRTTKADKKFKVKLTLTSGFSVIDVEFECGSYGWNTDRTALVFYKRDVWEDEKATEDFPFRTIPVYHLLGMDIEEIYGEGEREEST